METHEDERGSDVVLLVYTPYLLRMHRIMSWCLIVASPAPLYLSDAFFPFPRSLLSKLTNDFTVGMILNGGGNVDPASK